MVANLRAGISVVNLVGCSGLLIFWRNFGSREFVR